METSIGRNARVLISNPNHIENQFDLRRTMNVPKITVSSKVREIIGFISKRGNLARHFWGMSPLACFS